MALLPCVVALLAATPSQVGGGQNKKSTRFRDLKQVVLTPFFRSACMMR